jgi:LysR family transcriptional regulator of gallate degradation
MLTAISAHQLRYEIRDQTLIVLDFPLDGTRREIGIAQRQGCSPSPGARALMDEIRGLVAGSADFRMREVAEPARAARGRSTKGAGG